jgi:hypothetical protein
LAHEARPRLRISSAACSCFGFLFATLAKAAGREHEALATAHIVS